MTAYKDWIYFGSYKADFPSNIELFRTDGKTAIQVKEIAISHDSSGPTGFIEFKNHLYFIASYWENDIKKTRFWRTDGEVIIDELEAPSIEELDLPYEEGEPITGPSITPTEIVEYGGFLYFLGEHDTKGHSISRTDGESVIEYVTNVDDLNADSTISNLRRFNSPISFTVLSDWVYFRANDGIRGMELYRTNGNQTELVADIYPGSSSGFFYNPNDPSFALTVVDDWMYFAADDGVHGLEIWRSNGEATEIVEDINPGPASSSPYRISPYKSENDFGVLNGHFYFFCFSRRNYQNSLENKWDFH